MPKKTDYPQPEGIIPFQDDSSLDFKRGAEMTLKHVKNSTTYNRSMHQYTTECIYCGGRGWGYGKDPASAQQMAIRKCYADYRQRVWRNNTLLSLNPALKAAEKRLKDGLAAYNVKLSKFNASWHYNREFFSQGWGHKKTQRSAWMIQISIEYEIRLSAKSFKPQSVLFMALPKDLLAKLELVSNNTLHLDFDTIRWIAKHENRLDWLSKQYRRCWEAIPLIPVSEAKPGDILVEQYGRNYFEVVSISPKGSKIMVHWFNNSEGPQPVERLKKAETENKYRRISYADWQRRMNRTRGDVVRAAIQAAKDRIAK